MSTTTISDRITVTHHDDGHISVEATAPLPLHGDRTFEAAIFSGFCGANGFAAASWQIGNGDRTYIPASEFTTMEDGEQFLVVLAKLALAANGVSA